MPSRKIFRNRIFPTVVGWLILAVIMLVVIPMLYPAELPWEYHLYHLILFFILIGIYYLNVNILLPKIYVKKGLFAYIFSLVAISALLVLLMNFIADLMNLRELIYRKLYPERTYIPDGKRSFVDLYLIILTIIIYSAGIINEMIKKWNRDEKQNIILREQKSRAILNTLKAQIHPHFFFNTLNTIYAQTFTDVEKSQESLLKLSKMMRFAMNEDNREKVKLSEEINFINNYVDLMRNRLPENITLITDFQKVESDLEIAPMILLTFIENCFKHGITTEKDCEIKIETELKDTTFWLRTENMLLKNTSAKESSGIGIENTLKRLEILNPNKYSYIGEVKGDKYFCNLRIEL